MGRIKLTPRRTPSVRPARRGLATVEAAMVFPFLLLITFGAIEYGWMFLKQQQITNATRHAARFAATPRATDAEVRARVTALLGPAPGANINGYTTTITGLNATPGNAVTVVVSANYQGTVNSITRVSLIPVPATLSARVVMGKEGP